MIYIKPSVYALGQPLGKRSPASDWAYPKIPSRKRGKRHHHGGDVCGLVVLDVEFFVPAGTLIGVKLLRYITTTTTVTLPVFAFSITFRSPLMVSVAVLVTLIGRGSVDVKVRPKGLSNLRRLSTCNPVSLYPISYWLLELLLELSRELILCFFFAAFLSPFFHEWLDGVQKEGQLLVRHILCTVT